MQSAASTASPNGTRPSPRVKKRRRARPRSAASRSTAAAPSWSDSGARTTRSGRTRTWILQGPLPVAGYKATLHVEENKDAKSCKVEWSSSFEPAGASEPEAVKVIRGIYEAGFENLRKMFGQ